MNVTDPDPIRTRADGSIDTAFYMTRGRKMRSEAAHRMLTPPKTPEPAPDLHWVWRVFSTARAT